MGRVPRTSLPDGFFHVVSRGVFERRIYLDDLDRTRFVERLARCAGRHAWVCHAYCLMSTHYHLVVETTVPRLWRGVRDLNGRYAYAFNRRHKRHGHVFGERYSVRSIGDEQYLFEACAYVVLNPVKAGLCERVEEWPWSFSSFDLSAS